MGTLHYNCGHCGTLLRTVDSRVGTRTTCPACRGLNIVPDPATMPLRRTPKWLILARLWIIPFGVAGFWGLMLSIADKEAAWTVFLAGVIGTMVITFVWWGFVNIATYFYNPATYEIWKKNGGDPWFDTLPPVLNNDPEEVRYQELYRESVRQELENMNMELGLDGSFGLNPPAPPPPSDPTRRIDDAKFI